MGVKISSENGKCPIFGGFVDFAKQNHSENRLKFE
jgi:hypothetical protein